MAARGALDSLDLALEPGEPIALIGAQWRR